MQRALQSQPLQTAPAPERPDEGAGGEPEVVGPTTVAGVAARVLVLLLTVLQTASDCGILGAVVVMDSTKQDKARPNAQTCLFRTTLNMIQIVRTINSHQMQELMFNKIYCTEICN